MNYIALLQEQSSPSPIEQSTATKLLQDEVAKLGYEQTVFLLMLTKEAQSIPLGKFFAAHWPEDNHCEIIAFRVGFEIGLRFPIESGVLK